MLQTSLLLIKSLNKCKTPIFLSVVFSLFSKAIFLTFNLYKCNGKNIMCIQYRQHNIKQQMQNNKREEFTLQIVIRLY